MSQYIEFNLQNYFPYQTKLNLFSPIKPQSKQKRDNYSLSVADTQFLKGIDYTLYDNIQDYKKKFNNNDPYFTFLQMMNINFYDVNNDEYRDIFAGNEQMNNFFSLQHQAFNEKVKDMNTFYQLIKGKSLDVAQGDLRMNDIDYYILISSIPHQGINLVYEQNNLYIDNIIKQFNPYQYRTNLNSEQLSPENQAQRMIYITKNDFPYLENTFWSLRDYITSFTTTSLMDQYQQIKGKFETYLNIKISEQQKDITPTKPQPQPSLNDTYGGLGNSNVSQQLFTQLSNSGNGSVNYNVNIGDQNQIQEIIKQQELKWQQLSDIKDKLTKENTDFQLKISSLQGDLNLMDYKLQTQNNVTLAKTKELHEQIKLFKKCEVLRQYANGNLTLIESEKNNLLKDYKDLIIIKEQYLQLLPSLKEFQKNQSELNQQIDQYNQTINLQHQNITNYIKRNNELIDKNDNLINEWQQYQEEKKKFTKLVDYEKQKQTLIQEINNLNKSKIELTKQQQLLVKEKQNEKKNLEAQIISINSQLNVKQNRLNDLTHEVQDLESHNQNLKSKVELQQENINLKRQLERVRKLHLDYIILEKNVSKQDPKEWIRKISENDKRKLEELQSLLVNQNLTFTQFINDMQNISKNYEFKYDVNDIGKSIANEVLKQIMMNNTDLLQITQQQIEVFKNESKNQMLLYQEQQGQLTQDDRSKMLNNFFDEIQQRAKAYFDERFDSLLTGFDQMSNQSLAQYQSIQNNSLYYFMNLSNNVLLMNQSVYRELVESQNIMYTFFNTTNDHIQSLLNKTMNEKERQLIDESIKLLKQQLDIQNSQINNLNLANQQIQNENKLLYEKSKKQETEYQLLNQSFYNLNQTHFNQQLIYQNKTNEFKGQKIKQQKALEDLFKDYQSLNQNFKQKVIDLQNQETEKNQYKSKFEELQIKYQQLQNSQQTISTPQIQTPQKQQVKQKIKKPIKSKAQKINKTRKTPVPQTQIRNQYDQLNIRTVDDINNLRKSWKPRNVEL